MVKYLNIVKGGPNLVDNTFFQLLFVLSAYMIGSIPTGVWYSKLVHKVDVRSLGSGNSGGTNIGRNFGKNAALIVITIDVLKGLLPFLVAKKLFGQSNHGDLFIMATGIAAVLGHAYPVWASFKGGKIVATSIGVLLAYSFPLTLVQVLLLVLLIYLTSIMSLSAMLSYALVVLYILFTRTLTYGIGFSLMSLFMIYRHRENIDRLLKGQERHLSFGRHPSSKK